MEDAVKALIIAAGVMIAMMVVSLGITLGTSLSKYSDNAQEEIEKNAVQSFNEQFFEFINCSSAYNSQPEFTLTIHDIITAANTAYENNQKYGLTSYTSENYYVTINIPGKTNLERSITVDTEKLLKENISKKYKCTEENIKINTETGRVYEVTFYEI